ncbi:MAG: ABC transporter ATP-binding protein [Actinobacteria bacterium]|nr:ABC transporter ATP-binding protein [Actinomycetota bacterium]
METTGLTKYYGKACGILDLDLEVRPGEVFGFLGPNGAGKTTTIRLLLDLLRATHGRATVLGRDVRRDGVEVRRRVGFTPGELFLFEKLTGRETLRFLADLRGGVDWRSIDELAERLGAELDRRVGELSTGNKRKISLIQAFMHRPELLILDEPTAGLDPLMQNEFNRLIDEAREEGQTVFLSSHVLPEVRRLCDRVGFVRDGKLVAVEDVATLLRRQVRELDLVFGAAVPADLFTGIAGVLQTEIEGAHAHLHVSGSFDEVFHRALPHGIVDVSSREPDLDEVFLAYYGGSSADESAEGER